MIFHKPVIAMEAGDSYMSLALVKKRDLHLASLQTYNEDTCSPDKIKTALSRFIQTHELPKGTNILLLLRSPEAMFRFAELPRLPLKELRKLAKLNCRNYLPVNPEDYILDYRILQTGDSGAKIEFAALPRSIAEGYGAVFEDLGLVPLRFELYQNMIADYFVALGKRRLLAVSRLGKHISVIFIGSEHMQGARDFTVHKDGELRDGIGKLPGYFAYASIDTVYFMGAGLEEHLWTGAFPHCSFSILTEPHLPLQAFVRGHFNYIKR